MTKNFKLTFALFSLVIIFSIGASEKVSVKYTGNPSTTLQNADVIPTLKNVSGTTYTNSGINWENLQNITFTNPPTDSSTFPIYDLAYGFKSNYTYSNDTNDVIWALRGKATQSGSAARTGGGHSIGVAGWAVDTAGGQLNLVGVEGRIDSLGTADRYEGVLGLVNIGNTSYTGEAIGLYSVIMGTHTGDSIGVKVNPITVGNRKFAFYGSNDIVIDAGNIGVNTTNPVNRVQVGGVDNTTYTASASTTVNMGLYNNSTTNNSFADYKWGQNNANGVLTTTARLMGIQTSHTAGSESADVALVLKNSGTFGEKIRFTSGGNIGIGSTNPVATLDVTGTIRASSGTAGQATCWKADKTLGQCTSVVGAGGDCTCS